MSDPSFCTHEESHVGDRQVDVLAGYILRSDLGILEPSDAAWDQLHTRLNAPPPLAAPLLPMPLPRGVRFQQALLTTVPRMSSVGAALVLLVMFVNSSLHFTAPASFNIESNTAVHQPADPIKFVDSKLGLGETAASAVDEWFDQPVNTSKFGIYGGPRQIGGDPTSSDLRSPANSHDNVMLRSTTASDGDNLPSEKPYRFVINQ